MEEKNKASIGTKDLEELIDFGIALGKGIEKSMADKKITITDLPNILPIIMNMGTAFDGIENVAITINALDKESADKILAKVKELDLEDDATEYFIEDLFRVALDLYLFLNTYFFTKPKPTEDTVE